MSKIILLVVLVALFFFWFNKSTPIEIRPPDESAAPALYTAPAAASGSVKVESFQCAQNSAYYSAEVTIKNTGSGTIDFPRVFVRFTRKDGTSLMTDALVTPLHLPPGALGSVTLIGADDDGKSYQCEIERIQDTTGAQLTP